jgi:Zn-dependent peptidase ImmA (M78 family)/transcriptional regulator with XRE-family HTH domain
VTAPLTVEGNSYAGERIRALRTLLNLSQAELAEAIGVTQALISKVESGVRSASDELIDTVAAVTSTPKSFFHVIPPDLPPVTLRFRRLATAKRADTRRAEQLLSEAYRIVWTLVNDRGGYVPPALPAATDQVLGGNDIEALAERSRSVLGIDPDGPVQHVTRMCERRGIVVTPLAFPGDDSEPNAVGHFGGSCWPGSPEPALIGYFAGGPGDRQRFTIAHELGHLVLHTRRQFIADPESEANRFAGALLVPAHRMDEAMARGDLTLRDFAKLKARWGVSIQALIMRGSHLGFIDAHRKASLFKQLTNRGWRKEEPVQVHPEQPELLWRLLAERFGTARNSYQVAGNELGLPPFTLGQLAPRALPR